MKDLETQKKERAERAEKAQALRSAIIDFCLHDMAGKGCVNCILDGYNACWVKDPTLAELKAAVETIKKHRKERYYGSISEHNIQNENKT